ncbi:MAG: Uma2 family endonuclease [Planctomycetaceae bacterium]
MSTTTISSNDPALARQRKSVGEPTWKVVGKSPAKRVWSEAKYLAFNENRLIEFDAGTIEVLPMPTFSHQMFVRFVCDRLNQYATKESRGLAISAPLRMRLWAKKYREPDVLFMLREHFDRAGEDYWDGADIVIEVVSKKGRQRDLKVKRAEYAKAGIPEYWIVDPKRQVITVLTLADGQYAEHGVFGIGEIANSVLLPTFSISVDDTFAAAKLP